MSPKQSPPNAGIPPPPPPLPPTEGLQSPPSAYKPMANGDINNGIITPIKKSNVKKNVPPVDDTRNDLLKAIRDGELTFCFIFRVVTLNECQNERLGCQSLTNLTIPAIVQDNLTIIK